MKRFRARIIGVIILIIEKLTSYRFLIRQYKSRLIHTPYIIDIGSNRGQFIDMILKARPQSNIYTFEANPKFNEYLCRKYASNNNIRIFNVAISSKNEIKEFYFNVFDETSSFERLNFNSNYLKKKSRVLGVKPQKIISDSKPIECKTLDYIIENCASAKSIDLVKIDVEGHEIEVLKGLSKDKSRYIKRIQLEFHFDDMYLNAIQLEDIIERMTELSFTEEFRYKHKFGNFIEIVFINTAFH
jgi:FkbM family methyltransferase